MSPGGVEDDGNLRGRREGEGEGGDQNACDCRDKKRGGGV